MIVKKEILGIGISALKTDNALEYVMGLCREKDKHFFIVTPNPELVVAARENSSFKKVLNQAHLSLCDGIGLFKAASFLGKPLPERIQGVDFMQKLCEKVAEKPVTVGFLGGRGSVAEEVAKCLKQQYPSLKILFAEAGNPDEDTVKMIQNRLSQASSLLFEESGKTDPQNRTKTTQNTPKTISEDVNLRHISLLFVAFGSPKQELWIAQYLSQLPVTVAMGVGGAFDIVSGRVPRAPKLVRQLGLEWLYRLAREPWRIRRQLRLLVFLWLVLREKITP